MRRVIVLALIAITGLKFGVAQQLWVSPCPRLFSYEPQKENDRWYGVVTLISESDLKGVWLRVAFDRPSIQLGNWFGEIRTSDNMEYLIHNRNHELKANMPYALRFYIKYNPNETPPQLIGIRLNARPVCPEGQTTTPAAITGGNQLLTSAPDGKQPLGGIAQTSSTTPIPQTTASSFSGASNTFSRPGGGWPGPASTDDDDDDVFQGDFQLINRPHLRPQAEPECGTVVMAHERRKRRAGGGEYHHHRYQQTQQRQEERDQYGGQNYHQYQPQNEYQPVSYRRMQQSEQNGYRRHAKQGAQENVRRFGAEHGRSLGRTPNFPQIEYFYVDASNVATVPVHIQMWGLRDWILHLLNQRYDILVPTTTRPFAATSIPHWTGTTSRIQSTPKTSATTSRPVTTQSTTTERSSSPSTTTKGTKLPVIPYVGGIDLDIGSNRTNDYQLSPIPMNPDQELFADTFPTRSDEIAPLEQQPRPLITFGQSTREGEFPWHAALYHERGADLQYICGASLVSRSHVITVAHCVTRRRSATALNPDSLIVYLGKYYLKKWGNPGIQDSQVAAILPHPEYNSQTYANDIAILKLVNPVSFTDYVRPICLWGDGDGLDGVVNQPGTVVGWGFDHTGKVTEQLTQAKMPVVTKETCIYSFPDFFSRFTTSKTYCAGFRNGTSVCNGDSGGGMVFPKPTSTPGREIWQLRGLVSISVALQNQFKCDASHYVVFTDVAKYLDWIHTALRQ